MVDGDEDGMVEEEEGCSKNLHLDTADAMRRDERMPVPYPPEQSVPSPTFNPLSNISLTLAVPEFRFTLLTGQ